MKLSFPRLVYFLLTLGAFCGCSAVVEPYVAEPTDRTVCLNRFAFNVMDVYYLWVDEPGVKEVMDNWYTVSDPEQMVLKARYKAEDGSDIDRWTSLISDFDAFTSGVAGVQTTFGLDFALYYLDESKTDVCAVVLYTYADSPASEAGLQRGDCILKINGDSMNAGNYISVASRLYDDSELDLELQDGRSLHLAARTMYEDPLLVSRVFDCGGKKLGYLAYTSFTLDSCEQLIELSRSFRSQGVQELVLDLRYNSGGYVMAERVLASLLAPEDAVQAGELFTREIYNKRITEEWGSSDVPFQTDFAFKSSSSGKSYKFSTAGANMQISKIYALVSSSTASASEGLICGLMPYMDVELIGGRTYGKYCGGTMYGAQEWYDDVKEHLEAEVYALGQAACANCGIYVMIDRFADKNGETPCMPDGFAPDIQMSDHPQDGIQLGDPEEHMLAVALSRAGYDKQVTPMAEKQAGKLVPCENMPAGRPFGLRIVNP